MVPVRAPTLVKPSPWHAFTTNSTSFSPICHPSKHFMLVLFFLVPLLNQARAWFLEIALLVCVCMRVCVCGCVCVRP